jgi:hypothetical protein
MQNHSISNSELFTQRQLPSPQAAHQQEERLFRTEYIHSNRQV